jgi:hypothetical protein
MRAPAGWPVPLLAVLVCQLGPADAGGGIIFSPDLSMQLAAFMFVLILLFTLAWEEGTDHLEAALMHREQPHFLAMLSKARSPPPPPTLPSHRRATGLCRAASEGGLLSGARGSPNADLPRAHDPGLHQVRTEEERRRVPRGLP